MAKGGTKSFVLYRKVDKRPVRLTLGRFPDMTIEQARDKADAVNASLSQGITPIAALAHAEGREPPDEKPVLTLGELHRKYIDEWITPRGKRAKNPESYYSVYLANDTGKPACAVDWSKRPITEITATDVQALHSRIGKKEGRGKGGKVTANRVYQLLRAMFYRAAYWGDFNGDNPAASIERFTEQSRERYLQPDEMPRFFEALSDSAPDFRDFVLMCLLTGARRGNVQSMRWDQLYLERGTWEIPETKTGGSLTLALTPEAVGILEQRQEVSKWEWVFPARSRSGHLEEPKKAWADLLKRAEITDLRIHDLRRTLGSWQAAGGASLTVIGKTLGHKNVATTAIYSRLNLDPVRQSVNAATKAMLVAGKVVEEGDVEEIAK